MSMDPAVRKKALRLLTNGMYVLTSSHEEDFGAATVTWISQASFKPPLLMAAVRPESNVFKCISRSRMAALHILSHDQQQIAGRFFSPTKVIDGTLNGEPFVPGETKAPILSHVPSYIECKVHQVVDTGGDHMVVIMEAVQAACGENVRPLTIRESPWEYGG